VWIEEFFGNAFCLQKGFFKGLMVCSTLLRDTAAAAI
jgi:hypothetical protein